MDGGPACPKRSRPLAIALSSYRSVCRNVTMLTHLTATFQPVRRKQAVSFDLNVASKRDLSQLQAALVHGILSPVSQR